MTAMRERIELAQELYGLQVFPATILVGLPLTGFAGIIQVQHRSHGIYPQPICMVLI